MAPGLIETNTGHSVKFTLGERVPLNKQYQALEPSSKLALISEEQKTETHQGQPDIDWVPSFLNYTQRTKRRMKEGNLPNHLPSDFPTSVSYPMCWTASEINPNDNIYTFSEADVAEIKNALAHFKKLGISKDEISPSTFPLPGLRPGLTDFAKEVHSGRGFMILRGLEPGEYSQLDNIILYAGIASYIGEQRGAQDQSGNVIVHIRDVGKTVAPDDERQSPYANHAQPFHNDVCDIISMYVMDQAENGGKSNIASTAAVYNTIASLRPDLINDMAKNDWIFDKHEEELAYFTRPILFFDAPNNRVFFCFSRRQLTGSTVSPRPTLFPPMTEGQAEALDAVHFTAASHALTIQLEKGDIQFINNLGLFHAREAFTDGLDSRKRYLMRMWLRNNDLAWSTPQGLKMAWDEVYGGKTDLVWHLSPTHSKAHVINSRSSCYG